MSPDERRHRRKILKNRPCHRRPRNRRRPNTKITGERSEAAFLARAIQKNFGVAKPWGDSRRYDFILDNGEILIRIQVKCTESIRAFAYETRATYTKGNKHVPYTKKDIDFVAAHVVPLDLWYIIPVEVCTPAPMLRFYPHRKAKLMRLEQYKEAWHLILPSKGVVSGRIDLQASADDTGAAPNSVIPSEETDPSSGSVSQSRDLLFPQTQPAAAPVCPAEPHSTADAHDSKSSDVIPAARAAQPEEIRSARTSRADVIPTARAARGRNLLFSTSQPKSNDTQLATYRTLVRGTPAATLDASLAPWPIPKVRILAQRLGNRLLPKTPQP